LFDNYNLKNRFFCDDISLGKGVGTKTREYEKRALVLTGEDKIEKKDEVEGVVWTVYAKRTDNSFCALRLVFSQRKQNSFYHVQTEKEIDTVLHTEKKIDAVLHT
jgi:hypothetical protein